MNNFDVIIIGAGAAGLMCALRAGQHGKKVLLLEQGEQVGAKIIISGGGRCNFTNREILPERFISSNPHFCKSALKGYTQHDFIALVEKYKIPYHEKTLGQLFCDGSSRAIQNMLLGECHIGKVDIRTHQRIGEVGRREAFYVHAGDELFEAPALVLATGGLSIPKMGASAFSHRIATQFGIPLTETRAALVPLTFEGDVLTLMRALSGVSLEVVASCGKQAFREAMVFTHRGLSGPAILQISSYWREGLGLSLDLLPGMNAEAVLIERKKARPKSELKTILGEILPQRLAHSLTAAYFSNRPMGELSDKKLSEIARFLKAWQLQPTGSEGYAKAEVTLGGVDTKALSSKTMQVTAVPGLYIIGEAVDVTGWLGGYNFQWAWSSGWAAGSALSA
jgi:predicted Rossmann fold flavoprotein